MLVCVRVCNEVELSAFQAPSLGVNSHTSCSNWRRFEDSSFLPNAAKAEITRQDAHVHAHAERPYIKQWEGSDKQVTKQVSKTRHELSDGGVFAGGVAPTKSDTQSGEMRENDAPTLIGEQIMAPSRERQSHLYCSAFDNSYLEFVQPQRDKLATLYQISNKTQDFFFTPVKWRLFSVKRSDNLESNQKKKKHRTEKNAENISINVHFLRLTTSAMVSHTHSGFISRLFLSLPLHTDKEDLQAAQL